MTTFKDRRGNTHTIDLHIGKLGRISESLGVKVYDINELASISDDVLKQSKLLWLASESSEPFETFAKRLTLHTVETGMQAFISELCEVLPTRQAVVLRESLSRTKALQAEFTSRALATLKPTKRSLITRFCQSLANLVTGRSAV